MPNVFEERNICIMQECLDWFIQNLSSIHCQPMNEIQGTKSMPVFKANYHISLMLLEKQYRNGDPIAYQRHNWRVWWLPHPYKRKNCKLMYGQKRPQIFIFTITRNQKNQVSRAMCINELTLVCKNKLIIQV